MQQFETLHCRRAGFIHEQTCFFAISPEDVCYFLLCWSTSNPVHWCCVRDYQSSIFPFWVLKFICNPAIPGQFNFYGHRYSMFEYVRIFSMPLFFTLCDKEVAGHSFLNSCLFYSLVLLLVDLTGPFNSTILALILLPTEPSLIQSEENRKLMTTIFPMINVCICFVITRFIT